MTEPTLRIRLGYAFIADSGPGQRRRSVFSKTCEQTDELRDTRSRKDATAEMRSISIG